MVSIHPVFDNKKEVKKLWCQCIMCLTTRKLFTSCGINASYVCQQESCLKVVVPMHHVFSNKKAVYKLWYQCIVCCQQESCLKVVVSMHCVFVNKKAVYKLWYQCIICLSTKKLFKSCGVNASCVSQQEV